jgi:hypothetical protein
VTPELVQFRKWTIVAEIIERLSENRIEPVVLNLEGISLLLIHGGKAFFFTSCPSGEIAVETWTADAAQKLSSAWLSPVPKNTTFRQIATLALAKATDDDESNP